ncbi:hypothetical protein [Streptomyces chattanoogensis]|uniref:hypothetical protein n=1 Tax=Streptomyces chattanoogensis TaxID=66876 RepID=UPI0036A3D9D4
MSVSDPEPPKPSGSAAQHGDGKDAPPRPGRLAADGRGDGPRRTVRGGGHRHADGKGDEDPSADATPTAPDRSAPPREAEPSGPVPSEEQGDGHSRPPGGGSVDPTPSRTDRPSTPPASPAPSTPTAQPTQPPSGPPQPSSQASGLTPSAPVSGPGSQSASQPMYSQLEPGDWPDA